MVTSSEWQLLSDTNWRPALQGIYSLFLDEQDGIVKEHHAPVRLQRGR